MLSNSDLVGQVANEGANVYGQIPMRSFSFRGKIMNIRLPISVLPKAIAFSSFSSVFIQNS